MLIIYRAGFALEVSSAVKVLMRLVFMNYLNK